MSTTPPGRPVSPDGAWEWDGQRWVPRAPAGGPPPPGSYTQPPPGTGGTPPGTYTQPPPGGGAMPPASYPLAPGAGPPPAGSYTQPPPGTAGAPPGFPAQGDPYAPSAPYLPPTPAQSGRTSPLLIAAGVAVVAGLIAAALAVTHPWSSKHTATSSTTAAPTTPITDSTTTGSSTTTSTTTTPSTTTPNPFPVQFEDPGGKFSAFFSGQPTSKADNATSTPGVTYNYSEYSDGAVDQTVGYYVIPDGDTFDLHKGATGFASGANGTLLSEQQGTFQGDTSDTGIVSFSGGFLEFTFVDAGSLVYVIAVAGSTDPPPTYPAFAAGVTLTP